MDKLFSFGKSIFSAATEDKDEDDFSNPFEMFFKLDRDEDGKITEEDFVDLISKMGLGVVGDEAIRMAFKQVDTNGNEQLDMSEAIQAYETIKDLVAQVKSGSAE